ncbi:MAG: Sulfopyruvate decarboxylase subunit alpha [Promethearchaeota archaeon]|nr:MAG: Sulfopyruvate decarboxylase subunit alpha [Candidatus Lokiarchaeota archaeon]
MEIDQKIYNIIKASGIDLILSLPCIYLKDLLELINEKKEIKTIPLTREEEGIGIFAGAYFGGMSPLMMIQNSGLGNSINAIKSLLELYEVPIAIMMSHRGSEGEKIKAQIPMGKLTPPLLELLDFEVYEIGNPNHMPNIREALRSYMKDKKSVGILLKKPLWEV